MIFKPGELMTFEFGDVQVDSCDIDADGTMNVRLTSMVKPVLTNVLVDFKVSYSDERPDPGVIGYAPIKSPEELAKEYTAEVERAIREKVAARQLAWYAAIITDPEPEVCPPFPLAAVGAATWEA